MAKINNIYKCELCGHIVAIVHEGVGTLVCCNQNMVKLDAKSADSTTEKHVPVIEKAEHGYKVTVGSTLHPMEEKHFIEWIEIIADGKSYRQFLKPGDKPEATFCVEATELTAREYCNLHGLWSNK